MQTRLEKFNLILPFLFLIAAVAVYLFGFKISQAANENLQWLTFVLFFNGLHVVFTFGHLLYLPEFKKIQKQKRMTLLRHCTVLTLLFCASFYSLTLMQGSLHQYFAQVFTSVFIGFGVFHIRRQSLGISLLYNHQLSTEKRVCRQIEKFACLLSVVSSILCFKLLPASMLSQSTSLKWGWRLGFLSILILAGSIFFLKDKEVSYRKLVFNQRFLLHFFSPASFLCGMGSLSIHGIEYCLINQRIIKNTQASVSAKKRFNLFLMGGFLLLMVTFSVPKMGQWETLTPGLLVNILIAISISLSFYHYYLDGVLYRMKDPSVRSQIRSLILQQN